jgi:protein TonB
MKRVWIMMVLAGLLSCSTATAQETIIPYRPGFGPVDEKKVYDVVERMPMFPGGPAALMEFIDSTKLYPISALKQHIQGRVIVTFIVEKDGSITNSKVIRSVDPALDKEALRVVKKMPHWIPGQQLDRKVRVRYIIPVTFRIK